MVNKILERVFCGLVPVDNVDKSVYNLINKGFSHVESFSRQKAHYSVDNVEKQDKSLSFSLFPVDNFVDSVDRLDSVHFNTSLFY